MTWSILAVSIAAQLATFPLAGHYFSFFPVYFLVTNLVVVPLMSAAVPLGFLAVFSGWSWTAWATKVLVDLSERVASWHAQLEASSRVPDPPLWLLPHYSCCSS